MSKLPTDSQRLPYQQFGKLRKTSKCRVCLTQETEFLHVTVFSADAWLVVFKTETNSKILSYNFFNTMFIYDRGVRQWLALNRACVCTRSLTKLSAVSWSVIFRTVYLSLVTLTICLLTHTFRNFILFLYLVL